MADNAKAAHGSAWRTARPSNTRKAATTAKYAGLARWKLSSRACFHFAHGSIWPSLRNFPLASQGR